MSRYAGRLVLLLGLPSWVSGLSSSIAWASGMFWSLLLSLPLYRRHVVFAGRHEFLTKQWISSRKQERIWEQKMRRGMEPPVKKQTESARTRNLWMWKSVSVSWRKMKEEKLLTMDVHANQWQLSREPTTRASSPACEPPTKNDDGNQGSDSWIHDVLRGKSGWRCCWEPRLAQWREWRGVAWWLVRENEIVFRSRYIVLGLAVGGSGENGSRIVFHLQITVKYFDKLF